MLQTPPYFHKKNTGTPKNQVISSHRSVPTFIWEGRAEIAYRSLRSLGKQLYNYVPKLAVIAFIMTANIILDLHSYIAMSTYIESERRRLRIYLERPWSTLALAVHHDQYKFLWPTTRCKLDDVIGDFDSWGSRVESHGDFLGLGGEAV